MRDDFKGLISRGGETENCTKDWTDKTGWIDRKAGWISQGTGDL